MQFDDQFRAILEEAYAFMLARQASASDVPSVASSSSVPPATLAVPLPLPRLRTSASLRGPLFAAINHLPSITPYIPLPLLESHTQAVISRALADDTVSTYSSAVRMFIKFCDQFHVEERFHFPTSEALLCNFAAFRAGQYAYSTVKNNIAGLRAWHILHNLPWEGGLRLSYVLSAARRLSPPSKEPRLPVTRQMLEFLFATLDPSIPEHACILVAAAIAFWCQNRLGELFATTERSYDPALVPTRANLGAPSAVTQARLLHLPNTKCKGVSGEDVLIMRQIGPSCPIRAITQHLLVNPLADELPLLSYRTPSRWVCLTRKRFLRVCNDVWSTAGFPVTQGHSFRIGGTTEYLLRGVDPEVVKVMGRWSSDSFLRYWRCLDLVIPLHAELLDPSATPPPRKPARRSRKKVSFAV